MLKLNQFIELNFDNIIKAKNTPNENLQFIIENALKLKLGVQLKEYIVYYGFLIFKHIEFYGVNDVECENSDMIKETITARELFNLPHEFVIIETVEDSGYILCDTKDFIYEFDVLSKTLEDKDIKLEEYLLNRILN